MIRYFGTITRTSAGSKVCQSKEKCTVVNVSYSYTSGIIMRWYLFQILALFICRHSQLRLKARFDVGTLFWAAKNLYNVYLPDTQLPAIDTSEMKMNFAESGTSYSIGIVLTSSSAFSRETTTSEVVNVFTKRQSLKIMVTFTDAPVICWRPETNSFRSPDRQI